MAVKAAPERISIRSYDVGFGDCFLLTFHYPAKGAKKAFERHVLIDFGSFPTKKVKGKSILDRTAAEIEADCGGRLHAVVATHRHADHINGFATRTGGNGSGDIIARCKPKVVIQPWTEDPDAQPDARTASRKIPAGHRAFAAALHHMNDVAAFALSEAERHRGVLRRESGLGRVKVRELSFLGGDNIANRSAVENLIAMGTGPGRKAYYVNYGSRSGLESILPGVKTYVLGPPTLKQSKGILKQRTSDPDEFWQILSAAMRSTATARAKLPFPKSALDPRRMNRPEVRWLLPRLRALRGNQLLEIVRELDRQLNNTSVILLFETKRQKLLFPGDAQIENWLYALEGASNSPRVRQLLKGVTFYKVGHHGSRNATPKSLWNSFERRKPKSDPGRMVSMVSTEAGHHGSSTNKSEVPRTTLVTALKNQTHFHSTDTIKSGQTKHVVELEA